jgi:hypothetical protein
MPNKLRDCQMMLLRILRENRKRNTNHNCDKDCVEMCKKKWTIVFRLRHFRVCYQAFLRAYGGAAGGHPGQGGLSRSVFNWLIHLARSDKHIFTVLNTRPREHPPESSLYPLGCEGSGCHHAKSDSVLADLFWHDYVRTLRAGAGRVYKKGGREVIHTADIFHWKTLYASFIDFARALPMFCCDKQLPKNDSFQKRRLALYPNLHQPHRDEHGRCKTCHKLGVGVSIAETEEEKNAAILMKKAHDFEERKARGEWNESKADAFARPFGTLNISVDQGGDLPLPAFRPVKGSLTRNGARWRVNMGTVIDYNRGMKRTIHLTPKHWSVDVNLVISQIWWAVICALTSGDLAAACQKLRLTVDGPTSENKNQMVMAIVEYFLRLGLFPQGADICFLVSGHTFIVNDSTHNMVKDPWKAGNVESLYDAVRKISETVTKPHELIYNQSLPDWRRKLHVVCTCVYIVCNMNIIMSDIVVQSGSSPFSPGPSLPSVSAIFVSERMVQESGSAEPDC